MNARELLAAQAPIRARYREAPEAARVTLRASGHVLDDCLCRLETDRGAVVAGMHPGIGGSGLGSCPGDMLLEALAACAGVTLNAAATLMNIGLHEATVRVEGDLDFRGALALAGDVPSGFTALRLVFELDTDASDEQLATLMQRVERFCVVSQSLARPPAMGWTRVGVSG